MYLLPFADVVLKLPKGRTLKGDSHTIMPRLNRESKYIVSLDQSTTCTGITVGKIGTGIVMSMELHTKLHNRRQYSLELGKYLSKMLRGQDIYVVLIEDVFEGTNPRTYKLLLELRNILLRLKKQGLKCRIERINNLVWKSSYFKDINDIPNMFTREKSKELSKKISIEKYPWTIGFKEDAYDSIGIIQSYIDECFDGDWSLLTPRKINKFIYSEDRHDYLYEIISKDDESKLYEMYKNEREIVIMRYNTSLTPRENAYLSTAFSKGLIVTEDIEDSNWNAIFCIENNKVWEEDNKFIMVAASKRMR